MGEARLEVGEAGFVFGNPELDIVELVLRDSAARADLSSAMSDEQANDTTTPPLAVKVVDPV